jgi:alpha-glucosidase
LWSEKGALCSCPGYRLPGYRYEAEIYADAPDDAAHPMNTAIGERTVDRTAKLKVHLAPGGGAAIRIRPSGN